MTNIAAQFGEGDEHLARVSDDCAMRLDRHRFAGIQQVRKRTFPKRRNNRLAGSSGEFVKIPGHIISLAAAKPRIVFNGSAWPGKAAMNVDTPKPSSLRNMSVTISWGPAVVSKSARNSVKPNRSEEHTSELQSLMRTS